MTQALQLAFDFDAPIVSSSRGDFLEKGEIVCRETTQTRRIPIYRRHGRLKEDEFNRFYRKYKTVVLLTAKRLVSRHEDAEEITQNVFVRLWRGGRVLPDQERGNIRSWMIRQTRQAISEFYRVGRNRYGDAFRSS